MELTGTKLCRTGSSSSEDTWRGALNTDSESSHCGSAITNPTSIREATGLAPGLAQWIKGSGIAGSCSVGHGGGSALWLWCKPAAAAPI